MDLEVFVVRVTNGTFSFFFFLGLPAPTGEDRQVAPGIHRMSGMLVQLQKYIRGW